MDSFSKKKRSLIMSRIRSKGTAFELSVFKEVKNKGIVFKKNYSKLPGKPDIAILKIKKAVFLHSDFWHGWRFSKWEKKLNSDFWKIKIRKNRVRDVKVKRILRKQGWKILVIWEHSLRKNKESTLVKLINFLK
ncbi:MAG: very short patch repair endonuclease [Candidatus Doudnabacteria bacterium]|nr:very short patch repair endonuclease [Candidatus Doudnabacteria bacterium]